ncbi:hypothetical protein PYCCODRAFT_1371133, partial [Trametes coccinea BRFM310]
EDDIERAVQILHDAFKDDVGTASYSGGSARVQRDIYRRTITACLTRGQVYLGFLDDEPQGVAALIEPGADWAFYEHEDFTRTLSSYLEEWYAYHYIPTYQELYRSAFSAGERARRDAWNLKFLAVSPDHQRKGLGRELVRTLCGKADAGRERVTADVKNPRSVQWLRRFGFTHRGVKNFTSRDSAGFPLWCVVREPSSTSG